MTEPDNLTLVLLREIRADMRDLHNELDKRFNAIEVRLDGMSAKIESVKQAAFGESVMGRYAAAEWEEKFASVDEKLSKVGETVASVGEKVASVEDRLAALEAAQ